MTHKTLTGFPPILFLVIPHEAMREHRPHLVIPRFPPLVIPHEAMREHRVDAGPS